MEKLLEIAIGGTGKEGIYGNEYLILKFKLLLGEKFITPYDIEDKVGIQYEAMERRGLIDRLWFVSESKNHFMIPPPPIKYSSLKNILDLGKKLGAVNYDKRNEKSLVLKDNWDKLAVKNTWTVIETNPLGKMLVPKIVQKVEKEEVENLNLTIPEILWIGLVLKKVRLINVFDLIEDRVDLSDKIIRSSTFLKHKYMHWGNEVQEIFFGYFVKKIDSKIVLKATPILPEGVMMI